MVSRIATISRRRAGLILGVATLLVPLLAVNAARVVGELPGGGGEPGRGGAADAREEIGAALGYDPVALAILVLGGEEPASGATGAVAIRALRARAATVEGVAATVEGARSADGRTTTLSVHAEPGLGATERAAAVEELREVLDPGILAMRIGGPHPTAEAVRDGIRGEAPAIQLLVLPLVALILAGSLGARVAAATLLAAVFTVGTAIFLLGIAAGLFTIHASAAVSAAVVGFVIAVEASAGLFYRYREESGTVGVGPDALEYALRVSARAVAVGSASAAVLGGVLLFAPLDGIASIGAGLIAAAISVPAAMVVGLSGIVALGGREVGPPLPMIADRASPSGPAAFRLLVALRGRRRSALAAATAALLTALLAAPLAGSSAVGTSAAELPADEEARQAAEDLAAAFGPGAGAPVVVSSPALLERATAADEIQALASLPSVESVGEPVGRGGLGVVEVRPIAEPGSAQAQDAVEDVRGLAPSFPGDAGVTGIGALLLDGHDLLAGRVLAYVAAAMALILAGWLAWLRWPLAAPILLAALPAPLVGAAALAFVFEGGHLAGPIGYEPAGGPHLLSYAAVAAPLLAIGVIRSAGFLIALREELTLGGGVDGSTARAGALTLIPAAVATACGAAAAAAWLGSELVVANELAVGLIAGLVADLAITRALLAPALARMLPPGGVASQPR